MKWRGLWNNMCILTTYGVSISEKRKLTLVKCSFSASSSPPSDSGPSAEVGPVWPWGETGCPRLSPFRNTPARSPYFINSKMSQGASKSAIKITALQLQIVKWTRAWTSRPHADSWKIEKKSDWWIMWVIRETICMQCTYCSVYQLPDNAMHLYKFISLWLSPSSINPLLPSLGLLWVYYVVLSSRTDNTV